MCRCAPIFSESSGLGLYKPVRSVGSIRVRDFSVLQLCIGAQSFDRFFLVKWGGGGLYKPMRPGWFNWGPGFLGFTAVRPG
jgi:hypothetical protein